MTVTHYYGTDCRVQLIQFYYTFQDIQWNPSCEVTPFVPEKWPFKRGGLLSGVEINTFMFRFTLSSGLSRGVGLSSGWPLKRSSTLLHIMSPQHTNMNMMEQSKPLKFYSHFLTFNNVKHVILKCSI